MEGGASDKTSAAKRKDIDASSDLASFLHFHHVKQSQLGCTPDVGTTSHRLLSRRFTLTTSTDALLDHSLDRFPSLEGI
jgi:hypothetical protein